jgi:HlyD family secretion protein
MNAISKPDRELAVLLEMKHKPSRWLHSAAWIGGIALAVLLLVFGLSVSKSTTAAPQYETASVTRADLSVAVSATGNLAPTNKVDVGSELSGIIEAVQVQVNDHVKKGQVLARLDTSKLKDSTTQAEATLASAQAKLAQAEASLKESQTSLDRYREVSRLSGGKVPSKTEMTTAETTLAKTQADVANQRALVNEAQAELSTAQINLYKASIRSPINGVVLSRNVDPGQTVAASLQVATLFTVAEDLREMELKVYVDEADVGSVKEGQSATFTVDAYPNRKYKGSVTRVDYGSTTKDNVVSYVTVLKVQNDDLSLRPGMTATAEIATLRRSNVLLVPNTALRFTPATSTQQVSKGLMARLMPGPGNRSSAKPVGANKGRAQQVWTVQNGQTISHPITIGATDGQFTEVTGGKLHEGMQLITNGAGETK